MRYRLDIPEAELIDNQEDLKKLCDSLCRAEVVAYDTETSGLEFNAACYLIALAFADRNVGRRRIVIPTIEPHQVHYFQILKPWFENPSYPKVAHNALYDYRIMKNHGIDVQGLIADTMKLHHTCDEEGPHDLKSLAKSFLGLQLLSFKQVFGKLMNRDLVKQVFSAEESKQRAIDYASLDAWATLELFLYLRDKSQDEPWPTPDSCAKRLGVKNKTAWEQHTKLDVPLIHILQNMNQRGVPFRKDKIEGLREPLRREMENISSNICKKYNTFVNLSSPAQVAELLFNQLNLKPLFKTATSWSTNEETLENLSGDGVQVAADILRYRKLETLRKMFVDGLLKWIAEDGRAHSDLKAMTATNRLQSSNPNLLNLPKPDSDEWGIREAVEADEGELLVCSDYDGLEMGIAAALYGDESLADDIAQGRDPHTMTCALIYRLNYDDIIAAKKAKGKRPLTTDEEYFLRCRQAAKRTGFGINYGAGPNTIASQITADTGIATTVSTAALLIEKYLDARPGIRAGVDRYKTQLFEEGRVLSLLGRKRAPSTAFHSSPASRASAERQATNFPIQGTAADLITLAMLEVEKHPALKKMGVRLLLQIHDELLLSAPEKYAEEALEIVQDIMRNPPGWPGLPMGVPTPVSGAVAKTWAQAH